MTSFRVLEKTEEEESLDLACIIEDTYKEELVKFKNRMTQSPKHIGTRGIRSTSSQASGSKKAEMFEMLECLTPLLITTMSVAMEKILEKNDAKKKDREVVLQIIQKQSLIQKFENDKIEQYQRGENIRIIGMEESDGEDDCKLEEKVVKICEDIEVEIDSTDVSAVHRIGKRAATTAADKPRPVIVKLTRRKKRNEIMKKKSALKNKRRRVYINEDLTPLRNRLLMMVKGHEAVKSVTTRDGKIVAWLKDKPDVAVELESPDDLWKIGVETPDWQMLKLEKYVVKNKE